MNFCSNCGEEIKESTAFCTRCGHKINIDLPVEEAPEASKQVKPVQPNMQLQEQQSETAKRKINSLFIVLPIVLIVLALAGGAAWKFLIPRVEYTSAMKNAIALSGDENYKEAIIAARRAVELNPKSEEALEILDDVQEAESTAKYAKALDSAMSLLSNGDYEGADAAVRRAINLKPDSAEALDALYIVQTTALAFAVTEIEAMLENGEFDKAQNIMKELSISSEDQAYDLYTNYIKAFEFRPYIISTDASQFPVITAIVGYTGNPIIDLGSISVIEDGSPVVVASADNENGMYYIKFLAQGTENEAEFRSYKLSLKINGLTFPLSESYLTPSFEEANVTLVAADATNYPVMRVYFRVTDTLTGSSVRQLERSSFTVNESVFGGAYLEREVRSAVLLSQTDATGINITLAADKSDSISANDMSKIKQVMKGFVNRLHFGSGDKAEVIAFDTIVKVMSSYTNNESLLINGINNMSTDGMTAFYDAIYVGIRNAALQGGARCVIAFTDGADNMSYYSAQEVINYANEKQVPLYIIGVGNGVEAYTLRMMADQTNGQYWYIDDLYSLEDIYTEIYTDLQELYVVEYISDLGAGMFEPRNISVKMCGGGYKGECYDEFMPTATVETIRANGGNKSRYEIFVEDVSWEQANQRCFEKGGHLVTITSQTEQNEIIKMAESAGVPYVWLGGYTSYDDYGNVFAHWITGEPFDYSAWSTGQPSRVDLDGTPEWYIMLWNLKATDGWSWNDQRDDPLMDFSYYKGKIAYVCEYEY